MSGTREANTNSASVSDDNSAGLWRENVEPEPAVKQKGKKDAVSSPLLVRETEQLRTYTGGHPSPGGRRPEPQGPLSSLTRTGSGPWFFTPAGPDVVSDPLLPLRQRGQGPLGLARGHRPLLGPQRFRR